MNIDVGWYNKNATRAYPFDDGASLVDDADAACRRDIIVGLKVMVPRTAGRYVYVGALTVTPSVVSVVLFASDSLAATGQPVLSCTRRLPLFQSQFQQEFESQFQGAGGWIVFPRDLQLSGPYAGRFTLPSQSLLAPAAAGWYENWTVPSAGVVGQDKLTGLVRLTGGNDFEIVGECREIPDYDVPVYHPQYCGVGKRTVAVFRLVDKSATKESNVFSKYLGTCSGRPESLNCPGPQPVQRFGSVTPDCTGNITVEFRGCARIAPLRREIPDDPETPGYLVTYANLPHGVLVDCDLDIADVCVSHLQLPDETGRLPNEYDDLCNQYGGLYEEISVGSEPAGPSELPESPLVIDPLNFPAASDPSTYFFDNFQSIGAYSIYKGGFEFVGSPDLELQSTSVSTRNVVVQRAVTPVSGFHRAATIRVTLLPGGFGSLHNAAVIANLKVDDQLATQKTYYVAEIDADGVYLGYRSLRLAYFNGSTWVTLAAAQVAGLTIGDTYEVTLQVIDEVGGDGSNAVLQAHVRGITVPTIDVWCPTVLAEGYSPANGPFGMATNRAISKFKFLVVTDPEYHNPTS